MAEGTIAWINLFSRGASEDERVPMLSGSMAPALMPGDLLTVRPSDGSRAHRGDIIVFRDGTRLVAHRLVFAARLGPRRLLIEKGDANRHASLVRQDSVVGIVVAARRGDRDIIRDALESRAMGRRASIASLARILSLSALRRLERRLLHQDARL